MCPRASRLARLGGLLVLLTSPLAAAPQSGRVAEDGDLKPVAEALGAYVEARAEALDIDGARAELTEALDALRAELGQEPLRLGADLSRAVWLSRRYHKRKPRRGKVTDDAFEGGSFAAGELGYAYHLPKDYDPRRSTYPLLLALPDEGERPSDHIRARWIHRELLDGVVLVSPAMPAASEDWDRVQVDGRPGGLSHALTALRVASERFAVDFDRVFVAGHGKSVPAAIAAGNYGPQRFAGVIGRAGDAGELAPDNFRNLPTLFAGGGAKAAAFAGGVLERGFDNCTLAAAGDEREVWKWMQRTVRPSSPDTVELKAGNPFPTRAYWLRIAPSDPEARAEARVERSTNTVYLDADGVTHVTLYLNDALLDLGRAVTIVGNGVREERTFRRSLGTTLDLLHDGTSDPACVYVAEAVIEVGEEEEDGPVDWTARRDAEYERRLDEAQKSASKLWELHEWCASSDRPRQARLALERLLRREPDHAEARAALGHRRFGEHWLASAEAAERFERGQQDATAEARGHVKHKTLWLHPADRERVSKGLTKDWIDGVWLNARDRRRVTQGWARQDLAWIPAKEALQVDRGLFLVNDEWLTLAAANRRRAKIDAMWRIPCGDVLVHSTADREVARRAAEEMSRAIDDLRLAFGVEPPLPLPVAVLRDEEQYDRFAFGDPDGRRRATHAGRLHALHSAFFAESWFPPEDGRRTYRGMGVCYWDPLAPHGDLYGVHSARLAVGLSYADAIDPSPKAVRGAAGDGPGPEYYADFLAEKRLPGWLRYGGAVYAERYFRDRRVGPDGDPWWARKWSVDNLRNQGGLRPLDEVFALELDPGQRDDGRKLLIEAGLLLAFAIDGGCEPVSAAHADLKRALAGDRLHANDVKAFAAALAAHEGELRAFAGL
ncbi:MAG: hypothetical protein AAF682_12490 [Planctomycetota bacterium]